MEIKNEIQQKNLNVKVKAETTLESIASQLNDCFQYQELNLSVKNCDQLNIFLNHIYNTLQNNQKLTIFKCKFQFLTNMELGLILDQNFDFTHLISLSILIGDNIFLSSKSQFPLSQNLSKLKNLEQLSITLNLSEVSQHQEYFRLTNAYQQLNKLKSLKINLLNIQKNSKQFQNIIQDVKYLSQLSYLDIQLSTLLNQDTVFLAQEIQYLSQLNEFSLKAEKQGYITELSMEQLNKSLLMLKNLQRLSLRMNTNQRYNLNESQVEIFKFFNLKYLSYQLNSYISQQILNDLQTIQQLKNIDEIKLQIYFGDYNLNQISPTMNILSEINLTSLIISINFIGKKEFDLLIQSFQSNKNFKKLQQLEIKIQSFYIYTPPLASDYDNINLSNLQKFSFKVLQSQSNLILLHQYILPLLKQIPEVSELNIVYGNINRKNINQSIQLSEIIRNRPKLTNFTFSIDQKQYFTIEDFNLFLSNIQNLNNLSQLNLYFTGMQNVINNDKNLILNKSLEQLKQIQVLNLKFGKDNNYLQEGVNQLSEILKQLNKLKYLTLIFNKNNMKEGCFEILIKCLQYLVSLKSLNFCVQKNNYILQTKNNLSNLFILPINLNTLKIQLHDNNLQYSNIKGILQQISQLKNLKTLKINIQAIMLENNDVIDIKNIISSFKNISKLSLNFQQLNSLYLINLYDDLPFLKKLSLLKLKKIDFNRIDVYSIKKVKQLENVKECNDINQIQNHENNQLCLNKDQSINQQQYEIFLYLKIQPQKIPKQQHQLIWSFKNIRNIRNLQLTIDQNCQAGDGNITKIFNTLKYLTQLNQLNIQVLKNNQIKSRSMFELGQTLQTFKQLQKLSLTVSLWDEFKWQESLKFIEDLGNQNQLTSFQLNINSGDQLWINGYKYLLQNIGRFTHLQELGISIQFSFTKINLDKDNVNLLDFFTNLSNLKSFKFDFQAFKYDKKETLKLFFKNLNKLPSLSFIEMQILPYYCKPLLHKLKRLVRFSNYFIS